MELIIASYDDWLEKNQFDPSLEGRIAKQLSEDVDLHAWTIQYWGRLHEPESKGWDVTPLMRRIWGQVDDARSNHNIAPNK